MSWFCLDNVTGLFEMQINQIGEQHFELNLESEMCVIVDHSGDDLKARVPHNLDVTMSMNCWDCCWMREPIQC